MMARGQRGRGSRRQWGQSTLEYILVIAAVLLAIVAAVGRVLTPRVSDVANQAGNTLEASSNKFVEKLKIK